MRPRTRTAARVAALALPFVVLAGQAVAQVQVQVSARQIAEDDDVQVTFIFSGRGNAELPELDKDWKIVGQQRGTSTQVDWARGIQETKTTWSLSLVPKRSGQLTIGVAKVVDGSGKVVGQSSPVTILVRGVEPLRPTEANKEKNLPQGRVMLVAELSRDIYYAGEPFVVTYSLYIDDNVRTRGEVYRPEIGELTASEAVQRVDVRGDLKWEGAPLTVHGRRYSRLPVVREVWTVLRPDRFKIPSLKSRVGTSIGNFSAKSPPIVLEIRGVPEVGRPAAFREGAIGQFEVAAEIKKDDDQSWAVLQVTITGSGGLERLDAPSVSGVTGARVEVLEGSEHDRITVDQNGVTGKRVFQYLLTPERAGTIFVPALELTYFDPTTASFQVARSQPVTFQANSGQAVVPAKGASHAARRDRSELHSIQDESALTSTDTEPVVLKLWYLLTMGGLFCVFLLLEIRSFVIRRRLASSGKVRARRAHTVASRRLRAASKASAEELYVGVGKALRDYVEDRHGLLLTGLTNDRMRVRLGDELGYSTEVVERLIAELESCDFARFAPGAGSDEERKATLVRAQKILDEMEKHDA